MEQIKDITKLKLVSGNVLIQIHKKADSKIILPEASDNSQSASHAEVILVTKDITDLEPGDIVLDFHATQAFKFEEGTYAIVPRHAIKMATNKENFILNIDGKK